MTPDDIAEFLRLAAPSFVAGMLALTTALIVFGAQQRAARKAARTERLNQAFEHIMDGFKAVQEGVRDLSRTQTPDDLADSILRFSWLLGKRDQIMSVWLSLKANEAMAMLQRVQNTDERRVEIGVLKGDVATTLRAWRDRSVSRRMLMADIERLATEMNLTPEDLGVPRKPQVPGNRIS